MKFAEAFKGRVIDRFFSVDGTNRFYHSGVLSCIDSSRTGEYGVAVRSLAHARLVSLVEVAKNKKCHHISS